MEDTPTQPPADEGGKPSTRNILQTALLACGILCAPALLGIVAVVMMHRTNPPPAPPSEEIAASLTNLLADASASGRSQLLDLYRDCREQGLPTEEVNLRLWASCATDPTVLFRIPPPAGNREWLWSLSQDGLFAIAVSRTRDAIERCDVALYDMVEEKWLWTKVLPWPKTHDQPYVFNRHLILRYSKNGMRFALELSPSGAILGIDKLGQGTFPECMPPAPHAPFSGEPVAIRNGVYFTADPKDGDLRGYALAPLPGFCPAGTGDEHTRFSGNGLLKFNVSTGVVTVCDSLTQTVLQRIDAWPHTTNTVVTGTLATHDGSSLTVFLKTDFGGRPPVTREWSVAIALYTGTVLRSFNADALFARPKGGESLESASPDGLWQLTIQGSNTLSVTSTASARELSSIPLASLGLMSAVNNLSFLEEGRHVSIRDGHSFWLLDFSQALHYGDLLSRMESCTRFTPQPTNQLADVTSAPENDSRMFDPDALAYSTDREATSPSYLAQRAELFAAHQAWGYAAALLEQTRRLQEYDSRAPRVNPLLQARCQILSGNIEKAKATCREALNGLILDQTDYNRMIRYHLQGILFSQP